MTENLTAVRSWAQEKISAGTEPPWAWYQYMKLIETIDAILASNACVSTVEVSASQSHLRLVGGNDEPAQTHVGLPVQTPM